MPDTGQLYCSDRSSYSLRSHIGYYDPILLIGEGKTIITSLYDRC